MTGRDHIIPVLIIVILGTWTISSVLSICPYHCLKKLEPDNCPNLGRAESVYKAIFRQWDADYEDELDSSGSREWDRRRPHHNHRPHHNRPHHSNHHPPDPPTDHHPIDPEDLEADDPTKFKLPQGKLKEVITGLDINFNCRIFDQGKLHYRFKLDDQQEHSCLQCWCYLGESSGAEPGCKVVDKTKCYEMGLQIRPKVKEKGGPSKKYRSPPGTKLGNFPFAEFAQLQNSLQRRCVGQGCKKTGGGNNKWHR